MKYDFDTIVDRKGTYCVKYDMRQKLIDYGVTTRFDEDTIPAFTADMDFRCAQPIIDAVKRVAEHGIFGYTTLDNCNEYYDAVVNWFSRRYDWKFTSEDITYSRGTISGLKSALKAFTKENDGAIIMRPVYPQFTSATNLTGRTLIDCHLKTDENGYYTVDWKMFEKEAKKPENTAFILCNPHNPVGRVWSKEELKRMSDICKENDVIIISDDVHADLTRKGIKYCPIAVAAPDNENIVTLTAVNKTFNLAGLEISNVIIPNKELCARYREASGFVVPTPFAIAALIAAYNEGEEWLDQLIDYVDGNIDWALAFMKEKLPEVVCWRPEGTYVLWMDFSKMGFSQEELIKCIYEEANVALESGFKFDPDGSVCYERICVPMSRQVLKEAFYRIEAALHK